MFEKTKINEKEVGLVQIFKKKKCDILCLNKIRLDVGVKTFSLNLFLLRCRRRRLHRRRHFQPLLQGEDDCREASKGDRGGRGFLLRTPCEDIQWRSSIRQEETRIGGKMSSTRPNVRRSSRRKIFGGL